MAGKRWDQLTLGEPAGRDMPEWQHTPTALHWGPHSFWHGSTVTHRRWHTIPSLSVLQCIRCGARVCAPTPAACFYEEMGLCWDSRSLLTQSWWQITSKMSKPLGNKTTWSKQKYFGNHTGCSRVIRTWKWRYLIRKAKILIKKNVWRIGLDKRRNSKKISHGQTVT